MEPIQTFAVFAGAALSLILSYSPKLNTWYAGLESKHKQLISVGATLVVTALGFTAGCFALTAEWLSSNWGIVIACTPQGALDLITAFIMSVMANQGIYLGTKQLQTASVKAVIAGRDAAMNAVSANRAMYK